MPMGPSGRFVVELDPELKRELHSALAAEGLTLKEWFRTQAAVYLAKRRSKFAFYPSAGRDAAHPAARAAESRATYPEKKEGAT